MFKSLTNDKRWEKKLLKFKKKVQLSLDKYKYTLNLLLINFVQKSYSGYKNIYTKYLGLFFIVSILLKLLLTTYKVNYLKITKIIMVVKTNWIK